MSSSEVTNPLHSDAGLVDVTPNDESFDLETVEREHLPEELLAHTSGQGNGDDGDGHKDDGHGHSPAHKPSKVPMWIQDLIEPVFKIKKRKSTVEVECMTGVIQFISCLYVLPVVPFQMARAGYDETSSIIATAVTCSVGSILSSFITDTPFIIAPPTSVSIFLAVSAQQQNLSVTHSNSAVVWSGVALTIIGLVPPLTRFVTRLIPDCIQASTSIGIGFITALAGATELNIVVRGKYTIVDMGPLTTEVIVGIAALIIVAVMLHFHVKGAFCTGLIFGTLVWWFISGDYPDALVADPSKGDKGLVGVDGGSEVGLLVMNLVFLYILTLNGLSRSMSDLAGLTKPNGAIPRGGFLFIVCGLTTILSGYLSGPPILISPETAAGIKAGAKTGLSTLVCGILFGISVFFYPVFAAVPAPGTAPLLIIVGVVLFANVKRVDWTDMKYAVPAYIVTFFIPFTYSILRGVAFGYVIYIFIALFTGDLIENAIEFYQFYSGYIPEKLRLPESIVPPSSPRPTKSSKRKQTEGGSRLLDSSDPTDETIAASGANPINKFTAKMFSYMELQDDEGAPRVELG